MLEYENFMVDSFPKIFKDHFRAVQATIPSPLEKARQKAIFFVESESNGKYGFFAEAHDNGDMSKSNSFFKIPTSFDAAFVLPYIMNEGIDQLVVENIISVLKRSRRSSGFWNFFFDPGHKLYSLIPDDVDDTALAALVLYNTGNLSLTECQILGQQIGEHRLVEPKTGAITTWIPEQQREIIFSRYQQVPKLCVGVLTNLLWFLATIGRETQPKFIDSLNYVSSFVDELVENIGNDELELPGMFYYTNKHIHYFFIARFLQKSEYARDKFGRKFVDGLVKEFKIFADKPNSEALDIAFMILAVWHLGLHTIGQQNWVTDEREIEQIRENMGKLCERLVTLQDKKDGSFRAWVTYRWNNIGHWGGSKAMTTGFVLAVLGIVQREIYEENNSTEEQNLGELEPTKEEDIYKCWSKSNENCCDGQSSSDESR